MWPLIMSPSAKVKLRRGQDRRRHPFRGGSNTGGKSLKVKAYNVKWPLWSFVYSFRWNGKAVPVIRSMCRILVQNGLFVAMLTCSVFHLFASSLSLSAYEERVHRSSEHFEEPTLCLAGSGTVPKFSSNGLVGYFHPAFQPHSTHSTTIPPLLEHVAVVNLIVKMWL